MKVVHTLSALNTARGAENPLHDDRAARQLGYRAGLIGGVDMYGYMSYAAVRKWGRRWLEAGEADCALLKPVHEGDACDVVVVEDGHESLLVELRASGEVCARSHFLLAPQNVPPPEAIAQRAAYESRPPASPATLAEGSLLPTVFATQSGPEAQQFLADERDDLEIYTRDRISHPGYLLRLCNFTLSRNFVLGPWIHTASRVRNHRAIPEQSAVQARGRVLSHYEKRGHLMVDIEVQLVVGSGDVACAVTHSAIYKPREK